MRDGSDGTDEYKGDKFREHELLLFKSKSLWLYLFVNEYFYSVMI